MAKTKVDESVESVNEAEEAQIVEFSPSYGAVLEATPFLLMDSEAALGYWATQMPPAGTLAAMQAAGIVTQKAGDQTSTSLAELLESPIGLISVSQAGLSFESFLSIVYSTPFSLGDWASFLQLSEKELIAFQTEHKTFSQAQTEIILQIAQLQKLGSEILGGQDRFALWAATPSLILEGKRPRDFFNSTFGIQMLTTELHRIEYGILA